MLTPYEKAKRYRIWKIQLKRNLRDALFMIVGVFSAAFGLEGFLLTNQFIDGGVTGLSLLASNHKEWLKVNKDFSYQKTIDIMSYKLSTMNWHQQEG